MSVISHSYAFPAIGILGGGQLGKMLCQQASKWSLDTYVLDKSRHFPAAHVCRHFTEGDFTRHEDVVNFGRSIPLLTIEIESVSSSALHVLSEAGAEVHPHPKALDVIKDKGLQKQFYRDRDLPVDDFQMFEGLQDLRFAIDSGRLEMPFVLKKRRDGYDGRGVLIVHSEADLNDAFDAPCITEPLVDIQMELAVIVARNAKGEIRAFPPVGMSFHPEANLVEFLFCPAGIDPTLERNAIQIAEATIEAFNIQGLLAVEMFLTKDDNILINEVAPRPHNSGHHTIEACNVSQYEQHLRAILDLPLADIHLKSPSVMVNLLGEPGYAGPAKYLGLHECLRIDEAYVHLYGKEETRPWRKMGHVTALGHTISEALEKAKFVKNHLKVVT